MDELKKQAILEALRAGYSGRALDPIGKGHAVTVLKAGGTISTGKLDEMYSSLQALKQDRTGAVEQVIPNGLSNGLSNNSANAPANQLPNVVPGKPGNREDIDFLLARIAELEKANKAIAEENRRLRGEKKQTSGHVLGFQIVTKLIKSYVCWYGVKRIAGKVVWVYLGKNTQGAEEKIRAYAAKHGLTLGEVGKYWA